MLIMHIGFLASFHAISPERSGFSKISTLFLSLVALKLLVSLISRLVACSPRIECAQTDRQNDYCNPRCACAPRVNDIEENANQEADKPPLTCVSIKQ